MKIWIAKEEYDDERGIPSVVVFTSKDDAIGHVKKVWDEYCDDGDDGRLPLPKPDQYTDTTYYQFFEDVGCWIIEKEVQP